MREDELYKFSDGTLKLVHKSRLKLMVELIDKHMREMRIMRNLERLVGARELEMDYRLMQRTSRTNPSQCCTNTDETPFGALRNRSPEHSVNRWEQSFKVGIPTFHDSIKQEEFIDWLSQADEIMDFKNVPDDRRDALNMLDPLTVADVHQRVVLDPLVQFRRTSLTGFPAQSIRSSNAIALDSPYLLVLITGTSQSRQHESRKSPTKSLFDVGSRRISIVTVNTKEYHSDVLAIITRIMHRTY
ncbi:hypothetical protein Tco_1193958 [Tanacetum coccineum]